MNKLFSILLLLCGIGFADSKTNEYFVYFQCIDGMSFVVSSNGKYEQIKNTNGKYKTCKDTSKVGTRNSKGEIWTGKRWLRRGGTLQGMHF